MREQACQMTNVLPKIVGQSPFTRGENVRQMWEKARHLAKGAETA